MANEKLVVKLHDTFPPVEALLKHTEPGGTNKVPIDLTSAKEVLFQMRPSKGAGVIGGKCTYPAPTTGVVIYAWKTGDTSSTGKYQVEFKITWNAGGIETVPNEEYDEVEIQEALS